MTIVDDEVLAYFYVTKLEAYLHTLGILALLQQLHKRLDRGAHLMWGDTYALSRCDLMRAVPPTVLAR
eukprot:1985790-Amphidinium_carterae.1